MNIIGNALKIPVVTYGPGDPHSSHSIDEHIRYRRIYYRYRGI